MKLIVILVETLRRYSKLPATEVAVQKALQHMVKLASQPGRSTDPPARPRQLVSTRLPAELQEQIVCAYQAGLSAGEVAAAVELSELVVRRVLRHNSVDMRLQPLCSDEVDEAVKLYAEGSSLREVALHMGRAESSVQKVLTGAGVELRPAVRKARLSPAQVETATRDYQAGQSLAVIAESLGVGGETVRRALRAAGVQMRSTTGR